MYHKKHKQLNLASKLARRKRMPVALCGGYPPMSAKICQTQPALLSAVNARTRQRVLGHCVRGTWRLHTDSSHSGEGAQTPLSP